MLICTLLNLGFDNTSVLEVLPMGAGYPQTGDAYAKLPASPAAVGSAMSLSTQGKTDVQGALTTQGYTTSRATKLDHLDVDVSSVSGGGGGGASDPTGTGSNHLNHNGGAGILVDGNESALDILRYFRDSDTGANGLTICAYLVSEFDDATHTHNVKGTTTTDAYGRWNADLKLASGTYYIIADRAGDGLAPQKNLIVIP